ncbi:hypothetical protein PMG71_11805 [Roseofilum sp. BLCC_M154]|uniref:Uncharacterized protein n=1 Tax=Roseofilum acuticapitatum BLCC-M154 TaxID=3022444 RepID=A0ABT7AT87_9CYAN|nr:hypothetical protein [Roseofilum acuticapitatum]MDJ1170114.1 hypothetical protein [Roseofilum acuticapitatum BLCC-M154]
MQSTKLLEIERTIRDLSLEEQQWLLERLTQQVQSQTQKNRKFSDKAMLKQQLEIMAYDPEIQEELAAIDREFNGIELDGLTQR